MDSIGSVANPGGNRRPQREVHLDVFYIECAPVTAFWTKLHVPIDDPVFVIGVAEFETE